MWKSVFINKQQVIKETEKAVLVKIPKEKLYFWHPKKLVRETNINTNAYTLAYTEDFIFKITKYGKYFKVLSEVEEDYEYIEEHFGKSNYNIENNPKKEKKSILDNPNFDVINDLKDD